MTTIKMPVVTWALGDVEQHELSGVSISIRPLYYRQHDGQMVRAGDIKRDYAEPLMKALADR